MWDDEEEEYGMPSGQVSPPRVNVQPSNSFPVIECNVVDSSWLNPILDTSWLDELPSSSTSMGKYSIDFFFFLLTLKFISSFI